MADSMQLWNFCHHYRNGVVICRFTVIWGYVPFAPPAPIAATVYGPMRNTPPQSSCRGKKKAQSRRRASSVRSCNMTLNNVLLVIVSTFLH